MNEKIKIVLADDNKDFCQLLKEYLSNEDDIEILGIAKDGIEALELVQRTFPDVKTITENEISKLFVIDKVIYPRSVCIMFIMQYRGRFGQLNKSVEYFGNDLVLYSMRKSARKFLEDKIKFLQTGNGSKLIAKMPYKNIIRLLLALDYNRGKFMDVKTILNLYEKGVTINDIISERTLSLTDEEYYALR